MRELHVVSVSDDGRHVLLVSRRGATTPTFKVALDERLAAALRGDLPAPGSDAPNSSDLSPKEIQARLRAGESVEAIALAAGVPVARVERFSGPVQGEMARIIDAARDGYVVRGRLGRSSVPLGVAVDAALSLVESSIDWSTFREESGTWLVTVTWNARKRERTAAWRYDPAQKALTSVDPASAALAHVEAVAPKRKPAATAKKTPAIRTPAKKAPVKKAPAKKAPAKKAAVKKVPVKKALAKRAPEKARLTVVPEPGPRKRVSAAERDGVKTRASVPGWADVLLGTTPGGER